MAGGSAPSTSTANSSFDPNKNYTAPLIIVTLLFFMWGFITCMNDILIPKFKDEFQLSNVQANLVQFAFFGAYFVVSLLYYLFSRYAYDPISRVGYKTAIISGLVIASIGCFLFVPAASSLSFIGFLIALFILAFGITILQMGANPYVTLLGSPQSAESRLNLTQAFNALGTTVAPVIGGILILGAASVAVVKVPYVALGLTLIALAVVIGIAPLPKVGQSTSENSKNGIGALKYSHLALGVICIFAYVGGEVSIGSNIIQYLKDVIKVDESIADALLAVYWGGAMIGRFYGAIFLSDGVLNTKKWIQIGLLAVLAFVLGVFLVNKKYVIDSFIGQGEFDKTFEISEITPLMGSGKLQELEKTRIKALAEVTEKNSKEEDKNEHLKLDMYSYLEENELLEKINIKEKISYKLNMKELDENKKIILDSKGKEVTFQYAGNDLSEFKMKYMKPVTWNSSNLEIKGALIFTVMALLNVFLFLIGKKKAGVTLGIFALTVITLLIFTVMGIGQFSMWSVLCIGLFNSIMFPTIFSLAIKGLGLDTSQGSSLLVMAIVGGGLIPLLQGWIADLGSVSLGFIIPAFCYAYIAFYGFIGSKPKKIAEENN